MLGAQLDKFTVVDPLNGRSCASKLSKRTQKSHQEHGLLGPVSGFEEIPCAFQYKISMTAELFSLTPRGRDERRNPGVRCKSIACPIVNACFVSTNKKHLGQLGEQSV